MNGRKPPPLAHWMLEHLTLGSDSDALTGDVLEEFHAGRSRLWYWREVLLAIAVGFLREVRRRRSILTFALLWTIPTPALQICCHRLLNRSSEFGRVVSLPWPWSTACAFVVILGPGLVFLWLGMALYLALYRWIGRTRRTPRFGRGLLGGLGTYAGTYAFLLAALLLMPYTGHPLDIRSATLISIYSDPWFLLSSAPGFLALSVSIWIALRRPERTLAPAAG
jgi:hypothetical protein